MIFAHEDPEFEALLQITATERRLAVGLVEKDYWVTHTLWALRDLGFDVRFKGGTSLSKGFGLIERFSEDLDLKIEPGTVRDLPVVSNWKGDGTKATLERRTYFERLPTLLQIPGAQISADPDRDKTFRSANFRVIYPGRHQRDLGVMKPYVLLEVGNARATPSIERDMTSFVHDALAKREQLAAYRDNRPRAVHCVHPLVTLLEKLEAIGRRFPNDHDEPAKFVRHFEDAARTIDAMKELPKLKDYEDVSGLVADMRAKKDLKASPRADDPAFAPRESQRWADIRTAHAEIAPMFWGPRIPLDNACAKIRDWITTSKLTPAGG